MDLGTHDRLKAFIQSMQLRAIYGTEAINAAKALFGPQSKQVQWIYTKDAVNATNVADIGDDADLRAVSNGILALTRGREIIGRIQGWRRVPFHVPVLAQEVTAEAGWVAEGAPKIVSGMSLVPLQLPSRKIGGIHVFTKELVQAINDGGTASLTRDLTRAIVATADRSLLDPSLAASDASPASLTNAVTPISSTGADAAAVRADLTALIDRFEAEGGDLASATLVMSSSTAIRLALMQQPLGAVDLTAAGGTLFGLPVVASANVFSDSSGSIVALIDSSKVLLADGIVTLSQAGHATLQMDSEPTNPTVAATVMVSLWQRNLVGFLAERSINWAAAPGAVQWLSGVAWGE